MGILPSVSVIIPCFNEQATIALVLEALFEQTYPLDRMEVIVADGISSDHTRDKIADFCRLHPELRVSVVDNPRRIIPAAVNIAIEAAKGEIIVRLDAHSVPDVQYVEQSIHDLINGKGDNVGGIWMIQPGSETWIGRSIAAAAAHPFGVGDALYRFSNEPAVVDTVPFGAFYRSTIDRVGKFDETLLTNEDYEFNTRLRSAGGKVYLDPGIRCKYYARPSLKALSRQYWRYGYWKLRMLRRYPGTLRWRQALPPLFTAGLIALILAATFWHVARLILLTILVLYTLVLTAGAFPAAFRQRDWRLFGGIPMAIATMHFSWGAGFLFSIFASNGVKSRHP